MIESNTFSAGVNYLAQHGLNLLAVLSCAALPNDIAQTITPTGARLHDYTRLVLIGNGGKQFWTSFQAAGDKQVENPVDQYSAILVNKFIRDYLPPAPALMLFPGPYSIPLQRLGALAHWHHSSPLGVGIHSEYGLWFAYRAAFLTTALLPLRISSPSESPCKTCIKPCISACPVHAISNNQQPDLSKCLNFRLQEETVCADRCLARLACPIAPEQRYSDEQISYHYKHSLHLIRRYQSASR